MTSEEYWMKYTYYLNEFLALANSLPNDTFVELLKKYECRSCSPREHTSFNLPEYLKSFPIPGPDSFDGHKLKVNKWVNDYLKDVKRDWYAKLNYNFNDYQRESDGRIRLNFDSLEKYIQAYKLKMEGATYQSIGEKLRNKKKVESKDELNNLIKAGQFYVEKAEELIAKVSTEFSM